MVFDGWDAVSIRLFRKFAIIALVRSFETSSYCPDEFSASDLGTVAALAGPVQGSVSSSIYNADSVLRSVDPGTPSALTLAQPHCGFCAILPQLVLLMVSSNIRYGRPFFATPQCAKP